MKQSLLCVVGAAVLTVSSFAFGMDAPPVTSQELKPATRYSGSTPIDLSHGLSFNNGTYGKRNMEYEKWAEAPTIVPGVSELPYSYNEKEDFVRGMKESANFVQDAIWNWERKASWPEAANYSKTAADEMKSVLEKYKDAISKVKGAGKGDWENAQSEGRRALIELRGKYSQLHNNVR